MAKEKVVVAKRGCSCCGTGCVLTALALPLAIVSVWETFGVVIAIALWPTLIAAAHVVRYATGNTKRIRI